ncbi:MAG: NAD-dependent deacylase [Candidatus Thalassarchaeaceae archaeon]
MILRDKKVVVLTGAGISAESGVRTFRDNNGLWENHRVEDVATPEAWTRDPALVWRFYQARRNQLLTVKPNPAHFALAHLESKVRSLVLITQNVDDLHERGGSCSVIHMHGMLRSLRCQETGLSEVRMDERDLGGDFVLCNCCTVASQMRPDIVWFGEMPMGMDVIQGKVEECDVFIVIGSSGHVYPAAGLVNLANSYGAHTILVNFELPINGRDFDEVHIGKAGEILPDLVDNW